MMDRPDLGDNLESPGRDVPCTPAPHFPEGSGYSFGASEATI